MGNVILKNAKNEKRNLKRKENGHEQRRIKNVISKNGKHKKKNEIKKKMF